MKGKHIIAILSVVLCLITGCTGTNVAQDSYQEHDADQMGEEMSDESALKEETETAESLQAKETDAMQVQEENKEPDSLSEVYKDDFLMGVAIPAMDITDTSRMALISQQFTSMTCENEMKPDFLLNHELTIEKGDEVTPVIDYKRADAVLSYALEQGMKMRGHTLVWHSQTPKWLFTVNYDTSESAPLVDRDTMIQRMDHYIEAVMTYANTNYPGVITAWDVVNEAINPGDGQERGIRTTDNLWYDVIGEDYIELAFTFAKKYVGADQKLFYNDYGTYDKAKMFNIINLLEPLKEKNLVDGIGMQSHIQLDSPTTLDYQYAIQHYADIGLEIQITELDVDVPENDSESQEKLATRYRKVMTLFRTLKKNDQANITSVTFWGLSDDRSWLNHKDEPSYPLLFDKDLNPKRAFYGAINDPTVPLY